MMRFNCGEEGEYDCNVVNLRGSMLLRFALVQGCVTVRK